jgi:peptide/nickel transport system substrate-binding protein
MSSLDHSWRTRAPRARRASVAIVLALSLFAACGDGGGGSNAGTDSTPLPGSATTTTTSTTDDTCTAARVGGDATMASYTEARGLDPLFAGGGSTASNEIAAIYDVLMRYNADTGKFEPWVAESLTPNADSTVWTLKLRPNVKFSNGDPLNSAAVKASIERHQAEQNKSLTRGLALLITAMDPVDELTLTFTLAGPWGQFAYLLGGPAGMIVNPKAVAAAPDAATFAKNPAGGGVGPYVVEKYAPGESLVLKARTDYWGGPVCLPHLTFVTGQAAPVEALRSGQLDLAFLRDAKVIADAKAAGMESYSTMNGAGEVIIMNTGVRGSTPPTADLRVRQAVAMALDPKVIDQRANDGKGLPSSSLLSPNSRYYTDATAGVAYDPAKAKALVDQVKAERGWDGTLRFLCDNSPARIQIGLAVKTLLEAVGFKVDAQTNVTITQLTQQVLANADYELACWGYNVNDQSPWAKLDKHISSNGGANVLGYKNATLDQALVDLRVAANDDQIKAALVKLQKVWNETVPAAPIAASEEANVHGPKIRGIVGTQEATILFADAWRAK